MCFCLEKFEITVFEVKSLLRPSILCPRFRHSRYSYSRLHSHKNGEKKVKKKSSILFDPNQTASNLGRDVPSRTKIKATKVVNDRKDKKPEFKLGVNLTNFFWHQRRTVQIILDTFLQQHLVNSTKI